MDEAHRELEEIKLAMESLTADVRAKSELSDRLRRAHDEQCARLQDAKVQIEKQTRELSEKSDEIASARQMYEDLKVSLHEKDSVLKHLSSTNDQLMASWGQKLTRLEGENKDLAAALSQANAKKEEQVQKISFYEEEIKKLKCLLLESQRKCSDAERKAEAATALRRGEYVVMELEKENGKTLEQLKWKTEQFRHLEDAKEKLQDQFRVAKKEWESEKSKLVDEMCTLQRNLESKTRIAEDLHSRLQMCNQALAHEQSRRKMLEIQISESETTYQSVLTEYEEARLKIDKLTAKRDDEIASLRNLLVTKDTILKESEYMKADLEQENQELHASIKELRDAQINETGAAASLKNVRQKLRSLEHAHRECPTILNAKEAEWHSQRYKLEKELNELLSKLNCRDQQFHKLQVELEVSCSSLVELKMENEEFSVMHAVFLARYSELQLELETMNDEVELYIEEKVGQIELLKEQIINKGSALDQAKAETEREYRDGKALLERIKTLELIEQSYFLIQKELDGYKEMLKKSSSHVDHLKAEAVQRESSFKEDLNKISDALGASNSSLAEKQHELALVNFQLQQCKSAAERLEKSKLDAEAEMKIYQDESQSIRRELESSLLARMEIEKALEQEKAYLLRIMEEKEKKIDEFTLQISQMGENLANQEFESCVRVKLEAEETLRREKESFIQITEDKDRKLEGLEKELDLVEQEFSRAEIEAVMTLEQERINFIQLAKGKEDEIGVLQKHIISLVELTKSLEASATLELADKQLEVDTLSEAFEKAVEAHVLDMQELEYKKSVIAALQEEVEALKQKLETQGKASLELKKSVIDLQSKLETERSEGERKWIQLEEELESKRSNEKRLNNEVEELKKNTKRLREVVRQLTSERHEMELQMTEFSDMVTELMCKDGELRRRWESVAHKTESDNELRENEALSSTRTEGKSIISYRNKDRLTHEKREPLKEYNS